MENTTNCSFNLILGACVQNVSNVSKEIELLDVEPSTQRSTALLVGLGVLSFVGVLGNFLFILSFCIEDKLRTVSNLLITYLALADLLTCLVTIPGYIVMSTANIPVVLCWIWTHHSPLLPILSVYTQFLISMDRTVLVTRPSSTYEKWFRKVNVTVYVFCGWLAHIAFFALTIGFQTPPYSTEFKTCDDFTELATSRKLLVYHLCGFSLAYFGVAAISYGKLIRHVRNHNLKAGTVTRAYVKTSFILLFLCVFSITTTSLSPVLFYVSLQFPKAQNAFRILGEIGTFFFFSAFAINPLFYGYRMPLYKKTIMRILRTTSRAKPYVV